MARKRGGLAGVWDRNKQIIKPLATLAAGALGTPALGAAVGAAMGGFDRRGKSGFGFDLTGGAIGGASGYAMGKLGGMAGGKLGMAKLGAVGGKAGAVGGAMSPVTQAPSALKALGSSGKAWLSNPQNAQNALAGVATGAGILDARQNNQRERAFQSFQGRDVSLRERQQQQDEEQLAARQRSMEQLLPLLMGRMGGGMR